MLRYRKSAHSASRSITPRKRMRVGLHLQIAGLGVTSVLLTGALCLAGLHIGARAQQEADASVSLKAHVAAVSLGYLEARQVAVEFLQSPSEALIEKHNGILKRSLQHLASIETYVAPLPEGDPLKKMTALQSGLNLYSTRFQNLVAAQRVLGFDDAQGLRGRLRSAIAALRTRVSEVSQVNVTGWINAMRLFEKDFIIGGEEKDADKVKALAEGLEEKFETIDLAPASRQDLLALVKAYDDAFFAFSVSQGSLNEERSDFATVFDRNRPTLNTLIEAADERFSSAQQTAVQTHERLTWAIPLTVILVGLIAILWGRRIANVIKSARRRR